MTGRLARPPHPALYALLYEPQLAAAHRDVLPYLLPIDAAHVVMLAECGLLDAEVAGALLLVNVSLADRLAQGLDVFAESAGRRGVYFAYEGEYIARLGADVGGAAHLARSRNDINAAIARMRMRERLAGTMACSRELLDTLSGVAAAHVETTMSGFTHLQPAQPTTLGHYLAGVGFALLRALAQLDGAYEVINQSPMGAAAGYGTSLPIDRQRVASLLGFGGVLENSLDAVASRDYALLVLDGITIFGITLTRLATDLHAWSSLAYGFIGWPDELVSTSSIMPQKRNAFVLEHIRGEATKAAGGLVAALLGMKNVPFANSIEAGAEAITPVWPALEATERACRLLTLLLQHLTVSPDRARAVAVAGDTGMTAVADLLVAEYGVSFRVAHDLIGRALRDEDTVPADTLQERIEQGLAAVIGAARPLGAGAIARALDPDAGVHAASHGGGPAPASVRRQLAALTAQWNQLRHRDWERHRALATAADRRQAAIRAITDAVRREAHLT